MSTGTHFYDKATRRTIRGRIKQLHTEGKGYKEITKIMIDEGFATPTGRPIDYGCVANQGRSAGLRKNRTPRKSKTTTKAVTSGTTKSPVWTFKSTSSTVGYTVSSILNLDLPAEETVKALKAFQVLQETINGSN